MNSLRQISLSLFFLTIFFLNGCEQKPPKKADIASPPITSQAASANNEVKGPIVAKVNNYSITLEELKADIDNFNATVPADKSEEKIDTREKKIAYLKNGMVRKILLYQLALERGVEKKEEIRKAIESVKQNLLVSELVRQEVTNIEPAPAEIEDYYNQYKEQLKEPEERRLREIVVATEDQAKDILIELLKGGDFILLAQDRSISPSAKNKGDLGYIKRGAKFAQFDDAAFSPTLETGKISNYFKGPNGFYILRLEDKRGGKTKPLSEVREDIKSGLTILKQQQKIEELIGNLTKESKIDLYESAVE